MVRVAVMVRDPEVLRVAEKVFDPPGRVLEPGRVAWSSVLVKLTVPENPVAMLFAASLAVTRKLKESPAIKVVGVFTTVSWVAVPGETTT